MREIEVDPDAGTVRVQGGATWGEVDRATHEHGLAVPCGIISTTGVGGLTLGGGIGHLSRKYGLAIDSLLAADMVLADGSTVTASEDQNQDLFWALRGGGGNFGAVTSFLFRGNPVDTVLAGPMFWPLEQTEEVLRFYDQFIADAPEDVNGFFAFLTVPPGDPFPAELHMRQVCGVVWCCTGDMEQAEEAMRPAREFGPPLLDGVQQCRSRTCRAPSTRSTRRVSSGTGGPTSWTSCPTKRSRPTPSTAGSYPACTPRCTCIRSTGRCTGSVRTRPRSPIATRAGRR